MKAGVLAAVALALLCVKGASAQVAPLPTVERVDLERYVGRWHEIARLPNRFQDQCRADTAATYSQRADGTVSVVNECRQEDGSIDRIEGVARVVDPLTSAKLEVRFAPAYLAWLPFVWGDYWVLDLDGDYRVALVGEPSRKYLWILSRSPTLDASTYARLSKRASELGFDTTQLIRTPQRG